MSSKGFKKIRILQFTHTPGADFLQRFFLLIFFLLWHPRVLDPPLVAHLRCYSRWYAQKQQETSSLFYLGDTMGEVHKSCVWARLYVTWFFFSEQFKVCLKCCCNKEVHSDESQFVLIYKEKFELNCFKFHQHFLSVFESI